MNLVKREKNILIFTIIIGLLALFHYIFFDNLIKFFSYSRENTNIYKKYLNFKKLQPEIENRYNRIFRNINWGQTLEKHQLNFQIEIQELANSCNIKQILDLKPLEIKNNFDYKELFIQVDIRSSFLELNNLLERIVKNNFKMQIKKIYVYSDDGDTGYIISQLLISTIWMP